MPEPPNRPRPPSHSDLKPVLDEQPERRTVNHPGVDGVPQARPVRRGTLPGGMAAIPVGSGEYAPTLKAPAQPTLKQTWRVPTPPSAVALARRSDPPLPAESLSTSVRVPADAPAASSLQSAQEAILRDELTRERAKSAKLERDARAAAEARVQSFPPPVQPQRSQSPAPSSERESKPPSRGDWAKLRFKIATAIVAALVLVIAALAYWAVAAIDAKRQAIADAQEAKKKADGREEQWRSWASVVIWIEDCRDGRDVRSGEMLLPDLNKQGSARKLEPWQNPCSPKLPPPP